MAAMIGTTIIVIMMMVVMKVAMMVTMMVMARLKEHEVVQDEPVCKMVAERKCRDIQGVLIMIVIITITTFLIFITININQNLTERQCRDIQSIKWCDHNDENHNHNMVIQKSNLQPQWRGRPVTVDQLSSRLVRNAKTGLSSG